MVMGSIRRHGGTLEIESRPGIGTTFRIHLPYAFSPQKIVPVIEKKTEPSLKVLPENESLRLLTNERL